MCKPRPDVNEFHYLVCGLSVSSLYLSRNQVYRGTCAVVYDPGHVTQLHELSRDHLQRYSTDIWVAESAVSLALQPDHMNVETLGNTVPHLHTHIIPRYRSDPRWGRPIWTNTRGEMSSVMASDAECEVLAETLRKNIASIADTLNGA